MGKKPSTVKLGKSAGGDRSTRATPATDMSGPSITDAGDVEGFFKCHRQSSISQKIDGSKIVKILNK